MGLHYSPGPALNQIDAPGYHPQKKYNISISLAIPLAKFVRNYLLALSKLSCYVEINSATISPIAFAKLFCIIPWSVGMRFLSPLGFVAALAFVGLPLFHASASSAKNPRGQVDIPFERERALTRGDQVILKLNDDITIVPHHRIRSVPVINGRMGEHVDLDGVRLYFPYGRILTATTEFAAMRPSSVHPGVTEPNPDYVQVRHFDRVLGKACATTRHSDGSDLEMRISNEDAISLVAKSGNVYVPTYRVVTSADIRHLAIEYPAAPDLYKNCLQAGRRTANN